MRPGGSSACPNYYLKLYFPKLIFTMLIDDDADGDHDDDDGDARGCPKKVQKSTTSRDFGGRSGILPTTRKGGSFNAG